VVLGLVLGRRAVDSLVAVVLAPVCAACRRSLEEPTRGAVCASCWTAVVPATPLGCISLPPLVSLATAIGPYEGALKDIVHALKYDARPTLARHLALRMRDAGRAVLEGAGAAVPVPLHRSRERTRGFNQARALALGLGLPVIDALDRTRRTAAQADLPAAKRYANVKDAFALSASAEPLDGLVIVLVDDVSTTGATLNACAAALLQGGAAEVRALTAARAPLKASGRPR
jgi:ComF family protein